MWTLPFTHLSPGGRAETLWGQRTNCLWKGNKSHVETSSSFPEGADNSPFSFWVGCVLGTKEANEENRPLHMAPWTRSSTPQDFSSRKCQQGQHRIANSCSLWGSQGYHDFERKHAASRKVGLWKSVKGAALQSRSSKGLIWRVWVYSGFLHESLCSMWLEGQI